MDDDAFKVYLRRDALQLGVNDAELRRLRRRGELQAICRGAFVRPDDLDRSDSVTHHRWLTQAIARASKKPVVISHVSAAVLHALALWNPLLARVHVTLDAKSGGRVSPRRHTHIASLEPTDVTLVDGLAVTTVARTVVDYARTEVFEKAVVLGDSALHRQLVTPDELAESLGAVAHLNGASRAARAIAFMDGRSESVGESRSRVLIHRAHLPKPDLQRVIFDSSGVAIARGDFFFEEFCTVGEFDGHGKYTDLLRPGQTTEQALIEEKWREDDIRSTGAAVARWNWSHLADPKIVVAKLERAFDIGRRT
ncbi:hypothetical protein [Antrihabitans sp. YC2-6]|uniref:hypothetical protein n=1 Tax=Antrihabitans sp. YC2-6 TaxID=2799498 RepID=UPI0018F530E1|nr:hypothetical protein [Antrihabitans sp. YC2-6]MBJ8343422.1 hypothetical protein [Antrihabitans sp. YC2-6]